MVTHGQVMIDVTKIVLFGVVTELYSGKKFLVLTDLFCICNNIDKNKESLI